jgi:hypothetical protein
LKLDGVGPSSFVFKRPDKGKPDLGNPKLTGGAAHYVGGQKALGTFQELKFHGFSLVKGPVTIFLDRGKMYKNILTGGALNEAVPLGSIEPLDCSLLFHKRNSFRLIFKLNFLCPQTSGERLLLAGQKISCPGRMLSATENHWLLTTLFLLVVKF